MARRLTYKMEKIIQDLHYYRLKKKFNTMITVFCFAFGIVLLDKSLTYINISIEFLGNLWLPIFTSACTLLIDLCWDLEQCRREEFLTEIRKFGIEKLGYHKERMVLECAKKCKVKLWISGYKLSLTRYIIKDLMLNIGDEVNIRILISPPWLDGFKAAYGEKEQVMTDYLFVFKTIINTNKKNVEVRFTDKPLFSDLYRIDDTLITGPYIHGKDGNVVTADEFFTYYVNDIESDLFVRGINEYNDLWDMAPKKLSIEKLRDVILNTENNFYDEGELRTKIQNICEDNK